MATLPPLTFQTLRAADGDDPEEGVPVVDTGRTLHKKLQRHGLAHGAPLGTKKKQKDTGFSDSTFIGVFCVLVACGVAITLFLTLRN